MTRAEREAEIAAIVVSEREHFELVKAELAELTKEDTAKARERLESAVVGLVAEFMGRITGLRPPLERRLFPPRMEVPLKLLCDGLIEVVREHDNDRA
jgi:hypothetical protein